MLNVKVTKWQIKRGHFLQDFRSLPFVFPEVTFQDNISGKIVILCYPCSFSNAA